MKWQEIPMNCVNGCKSKGADPAGATSQVALEVVAPMMSLDRLCGIYSVPPTS